jgi:hypothetical protein
MVEIPNDNAPPPGWGQWENWPAPALEPVAGHQLSVRKVVPRLTSKSTEIYLLMAGAKQLVTRGLS